MLKYQQFYEFHDTPPSQDASTHQIWDSYLK